VLIQVQPLETAISLEWGHLLLNFTQTLLEPCLYRLPLILIPGPRLLLRQRRLWPQVPRIRVRSPHRPPPRVWERLILPLRAALPI